MLGLGVTRRHSLEVCYRREDQRRGEGHPGAGGGRPVGPKAILRISARPEVKYRHRVGALRRAPAR